MTDPTVATSQHWDVIIIGTGIGGATVGRSLALAGLSVLFLEKGGRIGASDAIGSTATPESRLAQGLWPHPVSRRQTNADHQRFYAAVGCAVGGTSIRYAAALERMSASDFDGLRTSTASVAPWPVSF